MVPITETLVSRVEASADVMHVDCKLQDAFQPTPAAPERLLKDGMPFDFTHYVLHSGSVQINARVVKPFPVAESGTFLLLPLADQPIFTNVGTISKLLLT